MAGVALARQKLTNCTRALTEGGSGLGPYQEVSRAFGRAVATETVATQDLPSAPPNGMGCYIAE